MKLITVLLCVTLTFGLSLALPKDCNCRIPVNSKIVNGKDSEVIPWQVSVQSDAHMCSGIILDDETVLTIKSCVAGHDPEELKLVVGINRLDQANENNTYSVKSINFPGDSTDQPENIAILKLQKQLNFVQGKVEKGCLRMYDSGYPRKWWFFPQTFLVTGFGYWKVGSTDSSLNRSMRLKPI